MNASGLQGPDLLSARVVIGFACVHCAEPVEIMAMPAFFFLPNRIEFLRMHATCLWRAPDQRGGS